MKFASFIDEVCLVKKGSLRKEVSMVYKGIFSELI
jgi:hypothetical protein